MIRITDVSRTFHGRQGPVEALADINLEISTGEFVAIVGRSGCGKSTLLRLVAGLLEPTTGEIYVDGELVTRPRREVGLVFQKPALLPWRSVIDNVLLPAELLGLNRRDYRKRAMELLEMVDLASFHKRRPYELSGGMQQRVALCRSLLTSPQAMLMDEPFSALDALTRQDLSVQLQKIHMEHRTTILFVTHSIEEAVLLADRVVVLTPRPGRVRTILDVDIPRPRTLGRNARLEEVARISAELHELLVGQDADSGRPAPSHDSSVPGPEPRSGSSNSPGFVASQPSSVDRPGID